MRKLFFVSLILLTIAGCKKDNETCWECNDINGNDLETQCGKSESEIKKLEEQNKWTCYKKQ